MTRMPVDLPFCVGDHCVTVNIARHVHVSATFFRPKAASSRPRHMQLQTMKGVCIVGTLDWNYEISRPNSNFVATSHADRNEHSKSLSVVRPQIRTTRSWSCLWIFGFVDHCWCGGLFARVGARFLDTHVADDET